jgi:hypothetical protein
MSQFFARSLRGQGNAVHRQAIICIPFMSGTQMLPWLMHHAHKARDTSSLPGEPLDF